MKTATYVLTYNSNAQLRALLRSFTLHEPRFLAATTVVDQSTIPGCVSANARLCETMGITHRAFKNSGASGGRFLCAELFHESNADAMFFFEDDMTLLHEKASRCRFGFPNHVDRLHDLCVEIVSGEQLDYLKLSFHEVYNDHSIDFPLKRPATFSKLAAASGLGYLVGDVYYSNWPMLITRACSRALFAPPRVSEGDIMMRAHRAMNEGRLRAGVLAAWPICHNRIEGVAKIDLA